LGREGSQSLACTGNSLHGSGCRPFSMAAPLWPARVSATRILCRNLHAASAGPAARPRLHLLYCPAPPCQRLHHRVHVPRNPRPVPRRRRHPPHVLEQPQHSSVLRLRLRCRPPPPTSIDGLDPRIPRRPRRTARSCRRPSPRASARGAGCGMKAAAGRLHCRGRAAKGREQRSAAADSDVRLGAVAVKVPGTVLRAVARIAGAPSLLRCRCMRWGRGCIAMKMSAVMPRIVIEASSAFSGDAAARSRHMRRLEVADACRNH
jgi:hypothetical protein